MAKASCEFLILVTVREPELCWTEPNIVEILTTPTRYCTTTNRLTLAPWASTIIQSPLICFEGISADWVLDLGPCDLSLRSRLCTTLGGVASSQGAFGIRIAFGVRWSAEQLERTILMDLLMKRWEVLTTDQAPMVAKAWTKETYGTLCQSDDPPRSW